MSRGAAEVTAIMNATIHAAETKAVAAIDALDLPVGVDRLVVVADEDAVGDIERAERTGRQ